MAAMRNERPSWFLSTPLNLTRRWLSANIQAMVRSTIGLATVG